MHATQTQTQRWPHCESGNGVRAQCSPVDVGRLRAPPQFLYELPRRGVEDSDEGPLWKNTAPTNISRWDKTGSATGTTAPTSNANPVGLVQNPPARSAALTFSDAVAIRVPWRFSAMQHSAPSWAGMSTGGFSVLARSTICTWPEWVPGKASRELLLLGHSTQRPGENKSRERPAVKLLMAGILFAVPGLQPTERDSGRGEGGASPAAARAEARSTFERGLVNSQTHLWGCSRSQRRAADGGCG